MKVGQISVASVQALNASAIRYTLLANVSSRKKQLSCVSMMKI